MNVVTNNGDFIIDTIDEIIQLILRTSKQSCDEIWVSRTDYPCIAVLINGNYANIHFFLNSEGDIWQTVGNNNDMQFIISGETQVLPGEYIISLEKAIEVVKEFCISMVKPKCVEWEEL